LGDHAANDGRDSEAVRDGMRIATACIALLMAGVAVTGCTVQVQGTPAASPAALATPSPAPQPPGDVFADAQGRFGLVSPTGWTVDTSGAQGTAVIFLDPQLSTSIAGQFSANINVLLVQSGADLSTTVLGARRELRGLTGYTSTADEPVTLGDGTPAHLLGGSFSEPSTGLALRNVQLFTVHGGATVVVTGTSLQDVWSLYEQTFQTSLRSLTVAT
jgi:hypothetical protein